MKQSNFVPVVLLLGGLLWAKAHGKPASGVGTMQDSPVSLENIRKGVARGWYNAALCTINGKPAVKLSGTANGKPYSDYYPVTQATWNALKNDGVKSIGACYRENNVGVMYPDWMYENGSMEWVYDRKRAAKELLAIMRKFGDNWTTSVQVYNGCLFDYHSGYWYYENGGRYYSWAPWLEK